MSLVKNYEYIRDWANNKFLTKDDKIEVDLSNLVEKDEINALIASGTQNLENGMDDLSDRIDYVSNRINGVTTSRANNTYRGTCSTSASGEKKYVSLATSTAVTDIAINSIVYVTFSYTNTASPSYLKLSVLNSELPIKTIINGQLVDLPSAGILKAGMVYAFAYVYINPSYYFVLMNCDTSAQPGTLSTTSTSSLSTSSSESLSGSISLHKIAKTGSYDDLNNKPTIPTTTSSVTSGSSAALTSGGAYTALSGKENTSNKVTSISSSSTDTQYPSAKAVYTQIGNIEAVLDQIIQPS